MGKDEESSKGFIPYGQIEYAPSEMISRSNEFYEFMNKRRSVRHFSKRKISREVIDNIIKAASTAPSGANKQPWTFCVVSNEELKTKVRKLAESEEKESYSRRMSDEWLEDLVPIGTNWEKEFIDTAPYIIVVMKKVYDLGQDKKKHSNYYVNESVGLASGLLIAAIHNAGLCTVTHTPSPMNFLTKALDRPENERAFLLMPIGYPSERALVPDLKRKQLAEVVVYYE
jgi:iodotyrosine deiodinase